MRLLIAEDDRMTADTLAKRLREEHYAVDVCYNGTDALDYLTGTDYDVAVLDIMMPGMDGIAVLENARQTGKHTPVLLLTAAVFAGSPWKAAQRCPVRKSTPWWNS